MWLLFEGGDHSRAASVRRHTVLHPFNHWPVLGKKFLLADKLDDYVCQSNLASAGEWYELLCKVDRSCKNHFISLLEKMKKS